MKVERVKHKSESTGFPYLAEDANGHFYYVMGPNTNPIHLGSGEFCFGVQLERIDVGESVTLTQE